MRVPSPRLLTLAVAAGAVSAAAVAMVLGILNVLGFTDALQLSIAFAAFGALVVVLIGVRRVDGKVQRLVRSHRKHAESAPVPTAGREVHDRIDEVLASVNTVLASLGEDRVTVLTHNGAVAERLTEVENRLASITSAVTDEVMALRPSLEELSSEVSAVPPKLAALSTKVEGLGRAGEAAYEQIEAYIDLRGLIGPRAPMPPLRGWAASPDVVRFLAEIMWRRRPKLIVECGSGSSSVWLGYLAERLGSTKVVALEHDERYAELSRDLIRAHGLDEIVEVRHAALADWAGDGGTYRWYDVKALDDLADIGVLFVDGPPGAIGPLARYPAVPLLLPRCGTDAVIVLDDTNREAETAVSDRWLAEHPELERAVKRFDKGAHVFLRQVP